MPARNHSEWIAPPPVEFVDSRIYSDPDIFEKELEKIFKKRGFRFVTNRSLQNHTTSEQAKLHGSPSLLRETRMVELT